ncbi:hypothetical protein PV682_08425 [Streptomyces niveiscabiei]|uniref:hypothetical protein n=1 Tax=Streptomyces niveiscabiei TaxID=164115 RepID=UPI0029AE9315|nr:hypothetical protein [Streptomyces niveiscabiei]MDX3381478.1 hypothetical protein [Streptomyces niveiscabiei]
MPPPPPSPVPGREREPRILDATLDDAELGVARAALAQGRWQAARTLLARTGDDWDRRGHRAAVLALEPDTAATDWLHAEPDNADAATLRALTLVHRTVRGRTEGYDDARAACRIAADLAPTDPTPWLGLLRLALFRGGGGEDAGLVRGEGYDDAEAARQDGYDGPEVARQGGDAEVVRLFEEVRARHPDHHQAHHLMVAHLAERRADSGPDPLHEVYDFAAWAAEQAPADSPLAILPVVAHAERYRVLAARGHLSADPAASGHWADDRAREVMKTAYDWWLEWEHEGHPRRLLDLNYLAHATVCAGRTAEASALFHRIADHATIRPWSYPARDPYEAFRAARERALGRGCCEDHPA